MKLNILFTLSFCACYIALFGQIKERERPAEWENLVEGAQFIDRFLPMKGETLSRDTWGVDGVIPRYMDNGIEDNKWSYWGGNILKDARGQHHLFVCGWLENSPRGHGEWGNSLVFHTVSDRLEGPYRNIGAIAKGHNPEVYRLKDGRYVMYVIDGRYIAETLDGPWIYSKFEFDARDRKIIEGLSNLTFAKREDGSYLMVCRGGGVWISKDGLSTYHQVTDKRVYPDVKGRFEDPVVWRDHIQYHLIVNDWLGRIAYYLRSKDGINWVTDPGEAYSPGIAIHADGTKEDWFKYERMKVYQDQYGRAIRANFAVIDTLKPLDKPNDKHSSKNISIPLNPGLLLTILNKDPITPNTKTIRLRIEAEEGFDPQTEVDVASLRFGASQEVNYGRGSKALRTEKEGAHLIVTFDGRGSGITEEEFAPKLLGKYKNGGTLYGYAKLPNVAVSTPILSARAPVFSTSAQGITCEIDVENFGPVTSPDATVDVAYKTADGWQDLGAVALPVLDSYERETVRFLAKEGLEEGKNYTFLVTIREGKHVHSTFRLRKEAL